MKHVLEPIEPPFSPEVREILKQYPRRDGDYVIRLFRVFANSTRFLAGKGVVNLLDSGSPLSLRERELVILRVTTNRDCEYEWGIHVSIFADAAGLSKEQIASIRLNSPDMDCWTAPEVLLLKCVDEVCWHARIQDDTYAAFQKQWNLEQQLEILALCGNYHTVCFVANTARVQREETGTRFPVPEDARRSN